MTQINRLPVTRKLTLAAKRILVTGGTGFVGRALVHRLLSDTAQRPGRITVFSRGEAAQWRMRFDLTDGSRNPHAGLRRRALEAVRFRIGDVRDRSAVEAAVRETDVIFHLAALKHVAVCEAQPEEARKTNVMGARNLVRAIRVHCGGPKVMVAVSSDKACYPSSVLGATKAAMERLLLAASAADRACRFICVRLQNVMGSSGSVVEVFSDQAKCGGPLTVTDVRMTRFLLPVQEAIDALLFAACCGERGSVVVPPARAVRIADLAAVIRGRRKVAVVTSGLQRGEKLHEVDVTAAESWRVVRVGRLHVIRPPGVRVRCTADGAGRDHVSSEDIASRGEVARLLAACGRPRTLPQTRGRDGESSTQAESGVCFGGRVRVSGLEDVKPLDFRSAAEWRRWLQHNHAKSQGEWVYMYKKGAARTGLRYQDALDEALCFGWIDGKITAVDRDRFRQRWTPRRPGSVWSQVNKAKVKRLIADGRMTDAGKAAILAAKRSGRWQAAYTSRTAPAIPTDLRKALRATPGAWEDFSRFAPSYRTMYVA